MREINNNIDNGAITIFNFNSYNNTERIIMISTCNDFNFQF